MRTLLAVLVTALSLVTACDGGGLNPQTNEADTTSAGFDASQSVEVTTDAMSVGDSVETIEDDLCSDYMTYFEGKTFKCSNLAGTYFTFSLESRLTMCYIVCASLENSEDEFYIENGVLYVFDGYFHNTCTPL